MGWRGKGRAEMMGDSGEGERGKEHTVFKGIVSQEICVR
jgi:hypothetical protein